jgi:CDP-diacylglycerol---serine O-phosphatidyltransferase
MKTPPAASAPRRFRLPRLRPRDPNAPPPTRRLPFDLRKALFILPNAFTVASIGCGFAAILLAGSDAGPEQFLQAGQLLILAAFFDTFDGRIARLTRTQSDFGMQMDSLADVMSFGLAPGVIVYHWGLHSLGLVGVLASAAFVACGAIRLARFNVLASRKQGDPNYFVGLPIPGAATMLISVVMAQSKMIHEDVVATGSVLALVLVLSYLMVSRVGFRTFKNFKPKLRNLPIVLVIVAATLVVAALLKWWSALVFAAGLYVLAGLVEDVIRYFKARQTSTAPSPPVDSPAA